MFLSIDKIFVATIWWPIQKVDRHKQSHREAATVNGDFSADIGRNNFVGLVCRRQIGQCEKRMK